MDEVEKAVETDAVEDAASAGFKLTWKHKSAIVGAIMLCGPMIKKNEGFFLRSYPDIGNVWTACAGVAGAIPNHTYTQSECDAMDKKALVEKAKGVVDKLRVPLTDQTLAAHIDFAYNVGLGDYDKSSVLRVTNQGNILQGCLDMLQYQCYRVKVGTGTDKGICKTKDLHFKVSRGLKNRRESEMKECIKGVK